jgi:hypothetical protein
MCTYASRLGISSRDRHNSDRSSLSYLEACLLGRTGMVDIVPYTNTQPESRPGNHRMKLAESKFFVPTSAEDMKIDWSTNRLETQVHPQVRSYFQTHFEIHLADIQLSISNIAMHDSFDILSHIFSRGHSKPNLIRT